MKEYIRAYKNTHKRSPQKVVRTYFNPEESHQMENYNKVRLTYAHKDALNITISSTSINDFYTPLKILLFL